MNIFGKFIVVFIALNYSVLATADDTDIYLETSSSGGDGSLPLVMMTLDYRPNLGSGFCNSAMSTTSCQTDFGIPATCTNPGADSGWVADCYESGDVTKDLLASVRVYRALDVAPTDTVSLFDAMRAVTKVLFTNLSGVKVGYMMSHDNSCSGSSFAGPTTTGCSNGAYILKGFFDPSDDTNIAPIAAGIPHAEGRTYSCDADGVGGMDTTTVNADGTITGPDIFYRDGDEWKEVKVDADKDGICSHLEDLLYALKSMPVPTGGLSHKFQGKEVYYELFNYLTGRIVWSGLTGYKDYGSPNSLRNFNLDSTSNEDADGDKTVTFAWDDSIIKLQDGVNVYDSPFNAGDDFTCSKTYVVNTLFQVSQQEDDSDAELYRSFSVANSLKNTLGGDIGWPSGNTSFPDIIRMMNNVDMAGSTTDNGVVDGNAPDVGGSQIVESYFVSAQVNRTTNGYADAGGTGTAIELTDPAAVLVDLEKIFGDIISQSSVFVAASVPVSVFNRLEIAQNIFIAMFQVEEDDFWPGNIKKLEIKKTVATDGSKTLSIVDAADVPAFDTSGRISNDAITFWTDTAGADLVGDDDRGEALDGKDGRSVTRGGAGQQVPGYSSGSPGSSNSDTGARQIYTTTSNTDDSAGNTLIPFDATADLADDLLGNNTDGGGAGVSWIGVDRADFSSPADALTYGQDIINWSRGINVDDADDPTSTRPWLMGDPMHSQPVALNYGTAGGYSATNPNIILYFGSNDGYLHWVQNTTPGGAESGKELGAFIPRELMSNIPALRDAAAPSGVTLPLPNASPHPYGIDGEPAVLVIDNDRDGTIESPDQNGDNDVAIMIVGLRRGGSSYYAFNVTNPATPPELMWRLDENDADFSEMGLSFSTVKFAIIQYEDTPRVAAIFGGGYNGGWDDTLANRVGKDASAAADTKGNAIYIVNVADGELIWKAVKGTSTGVVTGLLDSDIKVVYAHDELIDSIPSKVEIVDTNFDGIDDRIYVGDTGGSLWRVDIPIVNEDDTGCTTECTSRKDNWFISKLAQLDYGLVGDTSVASGDRRFFHAPDVVLSEDANGRFWGVAIGSGNRADPLDTVVDDWFFLIKDRILTSGDTSMRQDNASSFPNYTFDQLQSTQLCIANCTVNIDKGWKLPMGVIGSSDGEKVLAQPVISTGINDTAEIFFTSYVPTDGASSCQPSVGTGRVYIVGLEYGQPTRFLGGGVTDLGTTDRFIGGIMGIPPGVVRIGDYNMTPGGRFFETGADVRKKVYWRDIGVDYIK